MRRMIFFIFFLIPFHFVIYSQDFKKSIAISNNVLMDIVNEYSFYIDFIPFKHHSFGLCIADIHENPVFDPRPLSSSQNNNPGTVYEGIATRLYYNYYIFKKDNPRSILGLYISPQIIYKDLFYNNKTFKDANANKGGSITYTRNEKTTIIGGDIVCGLLFSFRIIKPNTFFLINPYVGFGYNTRTRNIETLSIFNNNYHGDMPILGKEIKYNEYLTIVFGIKIGILFTL